MLHIFLVFLEQFQKLTPKHKFLAIHPDLIPHPDFSDF